MNTLAKLHRWLLKLEDGLLAVLLLSLILIAVTQILLRNFFGAGLLWADAYTRISVLWLTLLGAMLASRQQKHLAIDAFVQYLPKRWQAWSRRLADAATAAICFAAAWFSIDFLLQEASYPDIAFADIPNWWCETIIPFAFAIIALRYGIAALLGRPEND